MLKSFLLHGIWTVVVIVLITTSSLSACAETPREVSAVHPATSEIIDPLTILRMFCEFLQAGQIDAAVNLLADDVVLTASDGEATVGRAAARAWLSRLDFSGIELCDIWLAGDQIAWTAREYSGDVWSLWSAWATIQNGKIRAVTFTSW